MRSSQWQRRGISTIIYTNSPTMKQCLWYQVFKQQIVLGITDKAYNHTQIEIKCFYPLIEDQLLRHSTLNWLCIVWCVNWLKMHEFLRNFFFRTNVNFLPFFLVHSFKLHYIHGFLLTISIHYIGEKKKLKWHYIGNV